MKSKGFFGMCSSDYQVTRLLKLLIEVLKNKIFVGKQKCKEISKLNLQYIFCYNFWFCRAIANIPAHNNKCF